jgi:hypothetical protein
MMTQLELRLSPSLEARLPRLDWMKGLSTQLPAPEWFKELK